MSVNPMKVRQLFLVSVGVLAGFAGGLIVSGRLSATQGGTASPSPAAAAPRQSSAAGRVLPTLPDLSPIAERAIQASVNISSTQYLQTNNWFRAMGGDEVVPQTSLGSGVIVSTDGYVLTNSHVAQTATADIKVTLPDNRTLPATVIGIDVPSDLALLKVKATGLNPLPWGDSNKLRVAEWVLAVGNPFQFSQTVTQGIISNVNRSDPQLAIYNDFIQTDAAINPGNSGGALVNSRGELVGINTMIYSQNNGFSGISFAIPANLAQEIMKDLKANGEIRRGWIGLDPGGLMTVTPQLAQENHLGTDRGVVIAGFARGSAAARAGLQRLDIVTKLNGTEIREIDQLQRLVAALPIGSTATVEVLRDTHTLKFEIPVSLMVPRPR
jgi:S1-C subfamily serine protease